MDFYVYILASRKNGTLYTGMTNDLETRIFQHKTGSNEGFTKRYGVTLLVYFEKHPSAKTAIHREKQIKAGNRKKKLNLIEMNNPNWVDLAKEWFHPDDLKGQ